MNKVLKCTFLLLLRRKTKININVVKAERVFSVARLRTTQQKLCPCKCAMYFGGKWKGRKDMHSVGFELSHILRSAKLGYVDMYFTVGMLFFALQKVMLFLSSIK